MEERSSSVLSKKFLNGRGCHCGIGPIGDPIAGQSSEFRKNSLLVGKKPVLLLNQEAVCEARAQIFRI
jgi:hypothetical protein